MYVYLDYYMDTIDDMQNEKSFYSHYNVFEYIHDYEKSDDDTLLYNYMCESIFNYIVIP